MRHHDCRRLLCVDGLEFNERIRFNREVEGQLCTRTMTRRRALDTQARRATPPRHRASGSPDEVPRASRRLQPKLVSRSGRCPTCSTDHTSYEQRRAHASSTPWLHFDSSATTLPANYARAAAGSWHTSCSTPATPSSPTSPRASRKRRKKPASPSSCATATRAPNARPAISISWNSSASVGSSSPRGPRWQPTVAAVYQGDPGRGGRPGHDGADTLLGCR